jgi:hypothetical protein
MRSLRLLLIAVGTVAGVYILSFVGMFMYFGDGCANEPIAEFASPDGKTKAIVFQRDCGATTGFSTQISLLPTGSTLKNESGNLFVSDTNHGTAPSGPGGGPEVRVSWRSATELVVAYHPHAKVGSSCVSAC